MTDGRPRPAPRSVCVAGGGPAGMMVGFLLARAGVPTTVCEKHGDFLRDFRGDTVHPSTLELFDELGLLDALLARPHDEVPRLSARVGGEELHVADFRHLGVRCGFIALMPQWDFLDFVADEARKLPDFTLRMSTEVTGLVDRGGRVAGVTLAGGEPVPADLVIAADGRGSVLRGAAGLPLRGLGAPMDVFWFRVPKARGRENDTGGVFERGSVLALIDRGDYWQCAYVFAKGEADRLRDRGLAAFKEDVARAAPELAAGLDAVASWDDVKLLTVALDRLERWHRPGLLVIGDAAHAMSPVGGVGINLAIQDAVAAANTLAGDLVAGRDVDGRLREVQARRMLPTRVVQAFQKLAHERIIAPTLREDRGGEPVRPPLLLRLLDAVPFLQRLPARFIGLGIRREHVRSPDAASG